MSNSKSNSSSSSSSSSLLVIGAGLPRTGTLSQKAALELLLGKPCHHMVDLIPNDKRCWQWYEVLDGRMTKELADEIFAGFASCVDYPASYYYRELMQFYPEAKVVLSVRDPASWATSVSSTVFQMCRLLRRIAWPLQLVRRSFWRIDMDVIPLSRDIGENFLEMSHAELQRKFEEHNEAVRRYVPSDRLLEFRVSDGWQPLCEFLGLPVPDQPFPRRNDTEEFLVRVAHLNRLGVVSDIGKWILYGSIVSALSLGALGLCHRQLLR